MRRTVGLGNLMGQMGQSWGVPTIHGTQNGKDSGIWATHWERWDNPRMSQLSVGHRMGRRVEEEWDLGHPLGEMGQSWDVPTVSGTQDVTTIGCYPLSITDGTPLECPNCPLHLVSTSFATIIAGIGLPQDILGSTKNGICKNPRTSGGKPGQH